MNLLAELTKITPDAQPYYRGNRHGEARSALVPIAEKRDVDEFAPYSDAGMLCLTDEGNGYAIGVYTADAWRNGDGFATIGEVPDVETAAAVVRYLVNEQPEGTDFVAWAAQRFDDIEASGEWPAFFLS